MRSDRTLTDLSDEKLAAAVELNAAEWIRLLGRLPWVELHDDGDVLWSFAGDTWPRNSVALARFTGATAPARIGEILAFHLQHKVACNWVVGSVTQPADLGRHLREHGFKCVIHCAGMGCDLQNLPPTPAMPHGVTVELLDEPPSLEPLTTERRRRRHEGRNAIVRMKPRSVWHFSAAQDGQPVGETALQIGAGVAGIHDVEVMEKFRGRGIGAALVSAALRHAEKLGYRAAVLGATGMGMGVYARCGFREVGKLSFWKYGKMRQLAVGKKQNRLEKATLDRFAQAAGTTNSMAFARTAFESTTAHTTGKFGPGYNVSNHFDFQYLPGRKYDIYWDPEGMLSTIPAVATCLLGVFAGLLLRSADFCDKWKLIYLFSLGAAGVLAGFLWGMQFPVVKKIWSSSFVLVAGGYSAMLLAAFYWIVDVRQYRLWCQPFVWIGMNSITVYLANNIIGFRRLADRFVGGDVKNLLNAHVAQGAGDLLGAFVGLGLGVLLVWFLHRKKIFLRL
jgi:GNAT superfamily N-acetyltransferase